MDLEKTTPKILLFPYLAHGHITPFIELAKNLSNHNFLVYLCSTPENLNTFARKLDDYSIRQVEFHLQSSPELPPHYHTTKGLPPHLYTSLFEAFQNSAPAFSNILNSVQPDLVIYDIFQTWLPNVATSYGVPAVYFQTSGAAAYSYCMHLVNCLDHEFPSKAIFYREYENPYEWGKPHIEDEDKARKEREFFYCVEQSNEIILVRSSRAFEEEYIDYQSVITSKKMVCVGSLVSHPTNDLDHDHDHDEFKIIQWLNGKEEASTVYVSFGSETYLTKEELKEIALGLEMSNVNFIWVVRSPNDEKTSLKEVMPKGFLDRIKEKGYVEEFWAPQAKILNHPSIGAFVSHCGWGSTSESISFGVPMIGMPMKYDQPLNAKLVAELGVGLEVVGDKNGKRKGEEIARIIEEVMIKEEGKLIRMKSKELGMKVMNKSKEEVDFAVQEMREICEKQKKP